MPTALSKLDPRYTLNLRGFDDRGAGAALHSVTADSFKVTGVFRDPADFCVLMLWDADNFYEHPRLKYLPDMDFSGVALGFEVEYDGLKPFDSIWFPTIDWPFLDVIDGDGGVHQIPLRDHATVTAGTKGLSYTDITIQASSVAAFDRVTLWWRNYAFDYIAAGGESASDVAFALAGQINGASYPAGDFSLSASVIGPIVRVYAEPAGVDGNANRMYAIWKNAVLKADADSYTFAGGHSNVRWSVSLDFHALGLDSIRQMWLTFSPAHTPGAAMGDQEWEATFTNWTPAGAGLPLKVAGPGSVRVEHDSRWVSYAGAWGLEHGFYSQGFARRGGTVATDKVTIEYHCGHEHDLWIGTSLYSDRGKLGVVVDGDAETEMDCYLAAEPPVQTRRKVRSALAAGRHVVTLTVRAKNGASSGNYCYFDFLEAVVPGDVPDAPGAWAHLAPACDYGTDHTYKLPPARILWIQEQLGFLGPLNVYVSVYWWNQRIRTGATIPAITVTFGGTWADGDVVFLTFGGTTIGKSVFPADTADTIAKHFAQFINSLFVGLWAEHSGGVLTVHGHSPTPAYEVSFSTSFTSSAGTLATAGSLTGAVPGKWMIDPGQTPTLNAGAEAWLADLCAECAARSRELTLAYSMELLNPPDNPPTEVWASRYRDGEVIETATGFGSNFTTHCAFNAPVLAYHKRVFKETADLMDAAGLDVRLQVGEFLWWFFTNYHAVDNLAGGMGFYDAETLADFLAEEGRALHPFLTPDDDPAVNGGVDADWLGARLHQYIADLAAHVKASHPGALIEILLPYDVNYPKPQGRYSLGGRLNRAVNIPDTFLSPGTAPFDLVKMEALDNGAGTRTHRLARETMRFPFTVGSWPKDKVRHLCAIFNGGCPWEREIGGAAREGIPVVNLWAYDHVCLFGWNVDPDRY